MTTQNINLSDAALQASVDAQTALLNVGGAGTINIYDVANVLLATHALANPAFGASVGGGGSATAALQGTPIAMAIGTSGVAHHFEMHDNAAVKVWGGLCGLAGTPLVLNDLNLVAGGVVTIVDLSHTQAN